MSRSFYKYKYVNNSNFHGFRTIGRRKIKPYCCLFHKPAIRFWYSQISFASKEEMRNANRSTNKRTRQYFKKDIYQQIKELINEPY